MLKHALCMKLQHVLFKPDVLKLISRFNPCHSSVPLRALCINLAIPQIVDYLILHQFQLYVVYWQVITGQLVGLSSGSIKSSRA